MKNLRRVVVVLGGVVGCAVLAMGAAVGCGSGSSGNHPASEAGADVTTPPDAHTDVQVNDVQGQDVVDSGIVDTGGETGGEAGSPVPSFLIQVATAFCTKLAACCTTEVPDGGTFDTQSCINVNVGVGYQGTALGVGELLEGGTLLFNPTKAAACLTDINAIDCTGNIITSQQQIAIVDDCTAAVYESNPVGTTCSESIQCASGEFCDTPTDGGGFGTCAALRGDGGACGNFGDIPSQLDFGLSEEACSYRRTGNTGLSCHNLDPVTGLDLDGGPAVWTCEPVVDAGAPCNFNQDCTSLLCDPGAPGYPYVPPDGGPVVSGGITYLCSNAIPFAYPNGCLGYLH